MIPNAISRALGLIEAHPAISAVRVADVSRRGSFTAEIDVHTALPAKWRMAAESPSGVRAVETVELVFPAAYPVLPPVINLRPDFNRSHPHLQPGSSELPPQPCIVAGSLAELIQARGVLGLIEQLIDWLDKAAMLNLNNPQNGWEPVRRDNIDDVVVVDGVAMRKLLNGAGGCIALQTQFDYVEHNSARMFVIDQRELGVVDLEKINIGAARVNDNLWRGIGIGLIVWPGDVSEASPTIFSDYLPETVTTIQELRERAKMFNCLQQLDAKLNVIGFRMAEGKLRVGPISVTFLVRRPYDVIGTHSPIELCSYLVDPHKRDDIINQARGLVRLPQIRETLSTEILKRASGIDASLAKRKWALIGAGSVGSKIALHLARQGEGPAVVVDRASIAPHNFARHACLPNERSDRNVFRSKAEMLADDLATLKQSSVAISSNAIELIVSKTRADELTPDNISLVVTTAASAVLREVISNADMTVVPHAEAHLLGAGLVAYAAVEGAERNPSLSDLAAESYRLISEKPELRSKVFGAAAEAIVIGQGCSALTFPMPDTRLSALTAGLAEVIGQEISLEASKDGKIVIGELGEDRISQTWKSYAVPPWVEVKSSDGLHTVRIRAEVDQKIREEVSKKKNSETGGVLVGRFSTIGNCFQVVDLIPPPKDSTFSAEKFVLGTSGLKRSISERIHNSGGSLYAVGTWHNHLVKSGPSITDLATAGVLALKQHFPILMLIALPEGYTFLIAEALREEFTQKSEE